MDQLAATIGAACTQAMQVLHTELEDQKRNQHAAIDLFQDRFNELRRLLNDHGKRVKALEDENAALQRAQQSRQASDDARCHELERFQQEQALMVKSLSEVKATQTRHSKLLVEFQALAGSIATQKSHSPIGRALDEIQSKQNQLAQSSIEQTSKLDNLEKWKMAHIEQWAEKCAHAQRQDDALAALESNVSRINGSLQNVEVKADDSSESVERRAEKQHSNAVLALTTGAREASQSSTSTFGTYEQMGKMAGELDERSLRRKPALSPLMERVDMSLENQATMSDEMNSAPKSSTIKLTKTGCDLVSTTNSQRNQLAVGAKSVANVSTHSVSPRRVSSKRKRMNAEEKAKMLAHDFVPGLESNDSRKRRRTAATKSVRFDFGEGIADLEKDVEAAQGTATAVTSRLATGNRTRKACSPGTVSMDGAALAHDLDANGSSMVTSSSHPREKGGRLGRKRQQIRNKPLRVYNNNNKNNSGKRKSREKSNDDACDLWSSKHNGVDADMNSSEDVIVVARPRIGITPSTSPPYERTKATSAVEKPTEKRVDARGSDDELALPSHPRLQNSRRSAYTTVSALNGTSNETYRNLLSKFNLTQDSKMEHHESGSGIEGRPRG